ncbi:MAG TPA: hypothetical protein VEC36_11615 [Patescibacteria group bacterium]|nr:hypothetical protein [Patescibacteria group bacterium]
MIKVPETVCSVRYDEKLHCGVLIWHGYASSEQLRACYERFLELVQKHGFIKGLSDNRNMVMFSAEDQEWLTKEFIPRLKATNFRYSAVVAPISHFARIGVDNVVRQISNDEIEIRYFQTSPEAERWLESIPDEEFLKK